MAITSLVYELMGLDTALVTFASVLADPTFYIYQDGIFIASTKGTTWVVQLTPGESMNIQVFDSASTSPVDVYPSRIVIGFPPSPGVVTDYYRVDQSLDSGDTWSEVGRVRESAKTWYQYTTQVQADGATLYFRVVAVGANGSDGPPRGFVALMVRKPDAPDVDYTYSSITAKVTMSDGS